MTITDNVLSTLILWTVISETALIVFGSIAVAQNVLQKCSTGLRMAFMIYPIAAAIKLIDIMFFHDIPTIGDALMYFGILIGINWIWTQRDLFKEFEYLLIEINNKSRGFFSFDEIKCIVCCIAVFALKKVGYCPHLTGSVCAKLTEDRRKTPRQI